MYNNNNHIIVLYTVLYITYNNYLQYLLYNNIAVGTKTAAMNLFPANKGDDAIPITISTVMSQMTIHSSLVLFESAIWAVNTSSNSLITPNLLFSKATRSSTSK